MSSALNLRKEIALRRSYGNMFYEKSSSEYKDHKFQQQRLGPTQQVGDCPALKNSWRRGGLIQVANTRVYTDLPLPSNHQNTLTG